MKSLITIVLAIGLIAPPVIGEEEGVPFVSQVYEVPKDFLSSGPDGIEFKSPMELLTTMGVAFPNGATAALEKLDGETFDHLLVRNEAEQLSKVDGYIMEVRRAGAFLVRIAVTFVTSTERLSMVAGNAEEPKLNGPSSATFLIESQTELVDLLTNISLDNAVSNARNRIAKPVSDFASATPLDVLAADDYLNLRTELRKRVALQDNKMKLVEGSTALLSGDGTESLLFQAAERGVGVSDVLVNFDQSELFLEIYSQGPQIEMQTERRVGKVGIAVSSGSTILFERRSPNGSYEYDFVTAWVVDPAGNPMNLEAVAAAAEQAAGEVNGARSDSLVNLPLAGEKVEPVNAEVDTNDLYTNVYQVPPTFLNTGGGDQTDPFAPAGQRKAIPRPEAREILANAGITFGEGASAIYQPGTSQLIVRNTIDQMELVEAYIESIKGSVERQMYITTLFVETDEKLFEGPEIGVSKADHGSGKLKAARIKVSSGREMAELLGQEDVAQAVSKRQQTEAAMNAKVAKIFSHSDFEAALKDWRTKKPWSEVKGESVVLRSGQGDTVLAAGKRGVGVVDAVIGADSFTVDVELMLQGPLPEERKVRGREKQVRSMAKGRATVWSGSTLAYARQLSNGHYQYDFITVEVINPSGQPSITEDEIAMVKKGEKPARFKKKPVTPSPRSETEITARDQENVKKADQLALQGNQLMSDKHYSQAVRVFARALEVLPNFPLTQDRRFAYQTQHNAALRASEKEKAAGD